LAEWTRITYFLPVTSVDDRAAYLRVLNTLRDRHPGSGHANPVPGFTTTSDDPVAINGFYWSPTQHGWVDDSIVLLFLDCDGDYGAVGANAAAIKAEIAQIYAEEGSPQEEIWCTAEPMRLI
jgi:hypothetical protein